MKDFPGILDAWNDVQQIQYPDLVPAMIFVGQLPE